MADWFFVTDIHGSTSRFRKLIERISIDKPQAVLLGGDLLPHGLARRSQTEQYPDDFVNDFMVTEFARIKQSMREDYPRVLLILGNDDPRSEEATFVEAEKTGIWEYINENWVTVGAYRVYGYAYVPPSPFLLKDWEKYDVSRFIDPGCVSPEEGTRTVPVSDREIRHATIKKDLDALGELDDWRKTIFLFHTPPYKTNLDRAALDGMTVDHVPVDVYVGSIAVREFIENRQPLVTLHGHIHESTRLTGQWQDRLAETYMFNAAHDGPELAIVRFNPDNPSEARRIII
ncbi:MAG: metallophosphoesterase [Candidatus Zixiibacteriota bacterium]